MNWMYINGYQRHDYSAIIVSLVTIYIHFKWVTNRMTIIPGTLSKFKCKFMFVMYSYNLICIAICLLEWRHLQGWQIKILRRHFDIITSLHHFLPNDPIFIGFVIINWGKCDKQTLSSRQDMVSIISLAIQVWIIIVGRVKLIQSISSFDCFWS